MRRVFLFLVVAGSVTSVALLSTGRPDKPEAANPFGLVAEAKNPWTSLSPNRADDQFQFVVVSDRTGGHRKGVFSKAVQQVNLLQPEFVVSVGDLIEGNVAADVNRKQWDDFDTYAKQFRMPFFYCAGNHDAANKAKVEVWRERLGRAYYHFTYKDCLFLVLNSNDGDNYKTAIGKDQLAYVEKALKDNEKARWTFVFLHHPLWAGRDVPATNWLDVEKLLAGRKHTAFCGHVHTFRKFLRNGTAYYQLATTGGSSAMRGLDYGEFDQVAWVTMSADGPTIAQIGLAGVNKDDLSPFESDEDGKEAAKIADLVEVTGTATLRGKPAAGVQVNFTQVKGEGEPAALGPTGSGRVGLDGAFVVYQTRGPAGLVPGRYAVTFALAPTLIQDGKPRENPIPEKYQALNKTPYRVDVKADVRNRFEFKIED